MNLATHKLSFPVIAFAAMLVVSQGFAAPEALARDRSVTATGANGKSATRSVSRANGDVSSSTTTSGGKTASRTVDRSAEGSSSTMTGPNGQSATRQTTRTETGSTTTVTGPKGQTGSVTVSR